MAPSYPSETMQVLSLVALMIAARDKFAESDWRAVLSRVIAEQLRLGKPHRIAVLLGSGMIDMDHALLEFVRIRYEEQTATATTRGPPPQESQAA
ncbi:hypothetical protein CA13_73140 [Planctomycetes bacterium CA13]|uniref:Uncharacterized protein n=1 Tax=Novipirellula herctigrandis TaxID=2527986 RepID=A0A5C5YLF6_9BACT|nr:hypothetical protein CA13_73140 [Planctomycetes bacterium CA13]